MEDGQRNDGQRTNRVEQVEDRLGNGLRRKGDWGKMKHRLQRQTRKTYLRMIEDRDGLVECKERQTRGVYSH